MRFKKYIEALLISLIFLIVYLVNSSNYIDPKNLVDNDVGYEYRQAVEMRAGINPYEKILSGNLLENRKYATLFPFYYHLLLVIDVIAGRNFDSFVYVYRLVVQLAEYAAFFLLYLRFRDKNQSALGIFAASFLLLNRWTILSVATLKQDIVAIVFLLASLYLFEKKIRISYLLYGISLGIKHLGIFVLPLYFTPLLVHRREIKKVIVDFLILASPIIFPAVPFLLGSFKAFYMSMVFSFTRKPASSCGISPTGYEKLLVNYTNLGNSIAMFFLTLPRLPLVAFLSMNTWLFLTKKIKTQHYLLAIYIIFAALNPVYFDQYILWIMPFAMISMLSEDCPQSSARS